MALFRLQIAEKLQHELKEVSLLFCTFLDDFGEEDCLEHKSWPCDRHADMMPCCGAPRLWRIGD